MCFVDLYFGESRSTRSLSRDFSLLTAEMAPQGNRDRVHIPPVSLLAVTPRLLRRYTVTVAVTSSLCNLKANVINLSLFLDLMTKPCVSALFSEEILYCEDLKALHVCESECFMYCPLH